MDLTNFTIKNFYLIKDLLKEGYKIKMYNGNKITLYLNKLEVTIEI